MRSLHVKHRPEKVNFAAMLTWNLFVMLDAHAEGIDEYSNKNGFLTTGAVNEASYCRLTSLQTIYNNSIVHYK